MSEDLDSVTWDQFIASNVQRCVKKLKECFDQPSALNDPVSLKKIRVWSRRTLAAMSLTPNTAHSHKISKQIKELKELIDSLGAVRDIDVAKEIVHALTSQLGEDEKTAIIQYLIMSENIRNACEQKLERILKRTLKQHLLHRIDQAFEELKHTDGKPETEN